MKISKWARYVSICISIPSVGQSQVLWSYWFFPAVNGLTCRGSLSVRSPASRSSVRVCAWPDADLLRCVCDAAGFILSITHKHTHRKINISWPRLPGTRHMVLTSLKRPRGSRDKSSICIGQGASLSLPLFVRKVDHLSLQENIHGKCVRVRDYDWDKNAHK